MAKRKKPDAAAPVLDAEASLRAMRRLVVLKNNRLEAQRTIGEMIKTRDALKEEIRAEGHKTSARRERLSDELVQTILRIEYERKRAAWLADEAQKTVEEAEQGKLFDDDERPTDVSEGELFASADERPVGRTDGDGDAEINEDAAGADATARMDAEDAAPKPRRGRPKRT